MGRSHNVEFALATRLVSYARGLLIAQGLTRELWNWCVDPTTLHALSSALYSRRSSGHFFGDNKLSTNFPSLLYLLTECITDSCSISLSAWGFSSSPWYFPCSKCSWLIHVYLAKPAFLSLPVSAEWWSVDDLFWISNWRLKLDTSAVGSSWEKVYVKEYVWQMKRLEKFAKKRGLEEADIFSSVKRRRVKGLWSPSVFISGVAPLNRQICRITVSVALLWFWSKTIFCWDFYFVVFFVQNDLGANVFIKVHHYDLFLLNFRRICIEKR